MIRRQLDGLINYKCLKCRCILSRAAERGAGGTMTPEPMDFKGPMGFREAHHGPLASGGPVEGPWAREGAQWNDTEKSPCEAGRPFYLEIISFRPEKPLEFRWRLFFFFEDHIMFRTKLQHFLRLFWTSQNRKSVIFELAPGPLSVPRATDSQHLSPSKLNLHKSMLGRYLERLVYAVEKGGFNFKTTGIPILYVESRCEKASSESFKAVSLADVTKFARELLEF